MVKTTVMKFREKKEKKKKSYAVKAKDMRHREFRIRYIS